MLSGSLLIAAKNTTYQCAENPQSQPTLSWPPSLASGQYLSAGNLSITSPLLLLHPLSFLRNLSPLLAFPLLPFSPLPGVQEKMASCMLQALARVKLCVYIEINGKDPFLPGHRTVVTLRLPQFTFPRSCVVPVS